MKHGGKTGYPPGLLQDDDRRLSRWFASRPDARAVVRKQSIERQITMTTEAQNLVAELRNFTGTEQYYVNPLYRWMKYTDGVKYFCTKAGAYWFLDIVGTELHDLAKKEEFMTVDLIVRDGKCEILVTDGNDTVLFKRGDIYTDCPTGTYRFFLQHNVFMVNWEY